MKDHKNKNNSTSRKAESTSRSSQTVNSPPSAPHFEEIQIPSTLKSVNIEVRTAPDHLRAKPRTYRVTAESLDNAIGVLLDHIAYLRTGHLDFQASCVERFVAAIKEQIQLQKPQTLDEQVKVLSDVMKCGPDPEHNI
jgi:hypothetical protein